jgi:hypothetical protein
VGQAKDLDWYRNRDNSSQFTPKKKLTVTLLVDALRAVQERITESHEALNWLMGRAGYLEDSVFSAENICDALKLDISALRSRLGQVAARSTYRQMRSCRQYLSRLFVAWAHIVDVKALWAWEMCVCDGCSQPVSWWSRRVRLERTRQFHRTCWQGQKFFSKFIALQCELQNGREPEPGAYQVNSDDVASQGLIAIWEFGWVSLNGGSLRAASGQFGYRAVPHSYPFGDITVALTQRM